VVDREIPRWDMPRFDPHEVADKSHTCPDGPDV